MTRNMNALGIVREEAEALAGSVPKRRRWAADQWAFRSNGTTYLVKDNRYSSVFYRFTLGRFLLRRETRTYRHAEGLSFVPRFYGRLDGDALILEKADATPLKRVPGSEVPGGFFRDLEECIVALHARGVVHLDLRQGGNILVTTEGRPLLVDFESALYLGPFLPVRRLLIRLLSWIDHSAVLKLRLRYRPNGVTEEERRRYRRYRRLRALWPVQRGGPLGWLWRRPREAAEASRNSHLGSAK